MIKYSKVKDKPDHRIKAMQKKELSNIRVLDSIISNCKTFNINLSPDTVSEIKKQINGRWALFYRYGVLLNYRKGILPERFDIEKYWVDR